jgi:serine/threonine protein phosphatase PrpC
VAIPRTGLVQEGPCSDCGNATFADGYCTACGHRRAEPDRDEARVGPVVLITDRGLHHPRNEDAAAAGTVDPDVAGRSTATAAVVCDGVSTSGEPQAASVAASKKGVEAMLAALAVSGDPRKAVLAGLADAAKAAVDAATGLDSANAPSCTYTGATVVTNAEGVQITVGNVGDSRAYWLPEPPELPQQLTVDDSVAQELMTAGASADSEVVLRGAHTITRWLGADAEPIPWSESSVRTITAVGPGSLLLCSDGLWNYLPDAADIAGFCSGTDPESAVRALTEHALGAGGQDNITVVLIPIGGAS